MNTKEALAELFKESVEDLEAKDPFRLKFRNGEFDATVDTYHWLENILSFEERYDRIFQRLARRTNNYLREDAMEFGNKMKDKGRHVDGPTICFTANYQTLLSHDIQFVTFRRDWETIVVLQVHYGGDPRNGALSHARVFSCKDDYDILSFDRADIGAQVREPEQQPSLPGLAVDPWRTTRWSSEDGGYRWRWDGELELPYKPDDLKEYEVTDDITYRGKGMIYVNEDGVGHCPILGEPLNLWHY